MVECTRNGVALNKTISREVLSPLFMQNGELDHFNSSEPDTLDVTRVTVTVREREAGEYKCNVTVAGRNDTNPQQIVTLGIGSSITMLTGE